MAIQYRSTRVEVLLEGGRGQSTGGISLISAGRFKAFGTLGIDFFNLSISERRWPAMTGKKELEELEDSVKMGKAWADENGRMTN